VLEVDAILSFFTDTLSGYVYIITTIISIIIILGIIGFLSERKFNLENNNILTRKTQSYDDNEIILGDKTLYSKNEEVIDVNGVIPSMNQNNQQMVTNNVNNENNHHDEVI
jgi:hypothetical protein